MLRMIISTFGDSGGIVLLNASAVFLLRISGEVLYCGNDGQL